MTAWRPRFVARFMVRRTEDGGPVRSLRFPENGQWIVPTRFDDSNKMATIAIRYKPNAKVENGDVFEADCDVLHEPHWAPHMGVGLVFHIWDGRDIVDATVTRVCPENWDVAPVANHVPGA
jgi:hypothetical protein